MLKKPVNGGADITKSGDQPAGINEGLIFAGVFLEDSAGGVVTKTLNSTGVASTPAKGAAKGAATGAASAANGCVQRRTARGQMGHGVQEVKMI